MVVAQDNNASGDQRTPVNRDHIIRQNGQPTKYLNFSGEKPSTPILDTVNYPMHMKNLSLEVKVFKIGQRNLSLLHYTTLFKIRIHINYPYLLK